MDGQDAEILAGVLTHCPPLAHVDLSENYNFGAAGVERIAEQVLGQCAALPHLNLVLCFTIGSVVLCFTIGSCNKPQSLVESV
jgi:hypothetical protein